MEKVIQSDSVTLNVPHFFKNPEFLAWLNSDDIPKFTWHRPGTPPTEMSDVIVLVDPSLTGEGTDDDMPPECWEEILAACRKADRLYPVTHILVRLTNLN